MAKPLTCSLEFGAGLVTVSLAGGLRGDDISYLMDHLKEAEGRKPARIELNLAKLEFVDSATLGFLIIQHQRLAETGVRLAVVQPHPNVMNVFRMTCLDQILMDQPGEAGDSSGTDDGPEKK